MKFYVCKHCGNLVEKLNDSGVPMICCGDPMTEMTANTSDGASEKHVPAITVNGSNIDVQVGSVIHPMQNEHYIGWIYLETKLGSQVRKLKPGDEPKASFVVAADDAAVAVYEWCNLHGLWKADA